MELRDNGLRKVSTTNTYQAMQFIDNSQNKVQLLAACGHVSASSQSLRFILNLRLNSNCLTSGAGNATIHTPDQPTDRESGQMAISAT